MSDENDEVMRDHYDLLKKMVQRRRIKKLEQNQKITMLENLYEQIEKTEEEIERLEKEINDLDNRIVVNTPI